MLSEHHYQHLRSSALGDDIIAQRGYRSIENYHQWHDLLWQENATKRQLDSNKIPFPALAIPLYRPGEEQPAVWVARPDNPRLSKDGKAIKYEYPRGAPNVLDVLPHFSSLLTETQKPIWLTEGAKKADALATLYGNDILPINENGVWGWRSKGKLVTDLNRIVWEGRKVILAPDGDVRHNKMVLLAVQRTSRLLIAYGAADVLILMLPCERDSTTGIDDYIALGHDRADVESHLVTIETVNSRARVPLMKHPETGAKLFLPPEYDVQGKTLVKRGRGTFYSGLIAVTSLGKDVHNGNEYATIIFSGKGAHGACDIARTDLASSEGIKILAAHGAAIHSKNVGEMSCYLVEFIQENWETLPKREYSDRYGITPDGGIVVAAGNVGNDNIIYTGNRKQSVGTNKNAYRTALQEIEMWSNTRTLWLLLSLSLASPVITRLGLDRNPTIYLGGVSGSGKTTLIDFCLGVWGDPRATTVQCGSATSTKVGINQAMTRSRGLPLFFEDVHAMLSDRYEARKIMGNIYDFANRQGRFIGSIDGKGRGGDAIGGTLFLAGEMLPEFQYAGQQRRMMVLDTAQYQPLGAAPRSDDGHSRAELLKSCSAGYGTLGYDIATMIWERWDDIVYQFNQYRGDESLRNTQAWGDIFAVAAATMTFLCEYADIGQGYDFPLALMRDWARIYRKSLTHTDPAREHFDRILTLMSQSEMRGDGIWQLLEYDRKLVAGKKMGDKHWRVLTRTPEFDRLVGSGTVSQFGQMWLEQKLVQPHSNGRVSDAVRINNIKGSSLLIDDAHVFFHEPDELAAVA